MSRPTQGPEAGAAPDERRHAGDLSDVMARLQAGETAGNVVLFAPRRTSGPASPSLHVDADQRPAPDIGRRASRLVYPGLLAASLLAHSSILLWFDREPSPLASLGEISVSVEIILGTDVAAGEASTPNSSEAESAAAPEREDPQTDTPQTAEPDTTTQETAPDTAVTEAEPAPAEPQPPAQEPPAQEVAPPTPDEPAPPTPDEPVAPAPATVGPAPDAPAAATPDAPAAPAAELPAPAKRAEPPRHTEPPRRPEPPRATPERKPTAAPPTSRPKPRTAQRSASAPSAPASAASSGVGIGRSDANTNYQGIVAAHLARHKQFPAEARARGDQGTTTVTFSIDGGGRVTAVRLTRASGIASFDRESEAMVRRASPFPAPPGGRGMSFTVPVRFHLR